MRGIFIAALILLASPCDCLLSAERASDAPTREWRDGPVRYIITRSEDKEFRELEREEDRRVFIDVFWRRRDPTPDTPGNEYRSTFWKRVREANSQFGRDNPRPGWRSDMGKIYILFGAPDEIKRDEMAEGRRNITVWIYRNSPEIGGISTNAGPNTVIAFAQDSTGEYRMTAEPSKVADVWEGLPNPQPPVGTLKMPEIQRRAYVEAYSRRIGLTDPVIREAGGPAIETPLGLTMKLASLQQPPVEWTLRGEVTTREFIGALPFKARAGFFKTTGQETLVIFDIAVKSTSVTFRPTPQGGRPALRVYARILDSTATQPILSLSRDSDFTPSPENDTAGLDDDLIIQGSARLAPGAYVARLTVLDEFGERSGTSDTAFTVPDFNSPKLELSTVSISRSLESIPGGSTGAAPFVLGNLRIIPRLGREFHPDEDLAFYYQVYGAHQDPVTGKPRLDVAYVFLAAEGEKLSEIGRLSFEGQETEAHGYALPLKNWAPGEYVLRVQVTDAANAATTSRDFFFRVTARP